MGRQGRCRAAWPPRTTRSASQWSRRGTWRGSTWTPWSVSRSGPPGPLGSESNKIILWPITLGGWLQEVYFSQGINKLSLLQWGGGGKTNVEYFSSINFLFLVFCIWFPHGPCDALWQNHFVHGKTTAAQFNIIRFVLYMMCSNQTFHETKIIKTQGTRYFAKFIFFLFKGNAKAVP